MAMEEIKLSKREQWAQNLKDGLEGMIPLADFWAHYWDRQDADEIEILMCHILLLEAKGGRVWQLILKQYCSCMNAQEKKDYTCARRTSRRLYETQEDFDLAEEEMSIEMFLNEIYPET